MTSLPGWIFTYSNIHWNWIRSWVCSESKEKSSYHALLTYTADTRDVQPSLPHKFWCYNWSQSVWKSFCTTAKCCVFVRAVYLCITRVISSWLFLLLKALDCNLCFHTAVTRGTWLSHLLQLLTELCLAITLKWMVETIFFFFFCSFALSRECCEPGKPSV